MAATHPLPDILQAIAAAAQESGRPDPAAIHRQWAEQTQAIRERLPAAQIEDGGESVTLGGLSPGCAACKAGTWDCLFLTMRCNLNCRFCYSPHSLPADFSGSVYGSDPPQIAAQYDRIEIAGISFSGGEAILREERLYDWLAWFKARRPDNYYWLYTNGLLANGEMLKRLAAPGLDEVRFNAAASGYTHPTVLRQIEFAARYLPAVAVEIPAIPADREKLLAALRCWADAGVTYLNLHELIYEPGSNSETMPGARQAITMPDGHRAAINPHSRALTLEVLAAVHDEKIPLAVNDCSLHSKHRQLRGRRRNIARLVKADHEKLVEDTFYESYCFYRADDWQFVHPNQVESSRAAYQGYTLARLTRLAPLSPDEPECWIKFEIVPPPV